MGEQIWTAQFDDVLDNVFELQDSIALRVADELRVALTSNERQEVAALPTGSKEAYDHYLKGRYFYYHATFEDNERAVTEYQKALKIDPNYTLAMAGLADAYVQRYKERYDYDEQWLDEAKGMVEPTQEDVVKAARASLTLDQLIAENDAQGLCVGTCMGWLPRGFPCLGFSRLNDRGIPAACDGDMD